MSHVFSFDNCNFYFISIARLFMFKRVWAKTYNSIWNVHIQFYMNKKILTTLGIQEQTHNYFMRKQNEVCQDMTQEWSCVRVILRVREKTRRKRDKSLVTSVPPIRGFFFLEWAFVSLPSYRTLEWVCLKLYISLVIQKCFQGYPVLEFLCRLNSCERDHLMLLNLQNINYLVF